MPDVVLAQFGDWKYFQPHYFGPCQLAFIDDQAYGQMDIDVLSGPKLLVGWTASRLVRRFADGSQLYRCKIASIPNLNAMATGTCQVNSTFGVAVDVFHHTLPETVDMIRTSQHFRGSRWNIQGTRELANVCYAYFTSLATIRSNADLQAIAMSSDGRLPLRRTNGRDLSDIIHLPVYRQTTLDRSATLPVSVPVDLIASQHVYRHAPLDGPVYYEVCHPLIARVGLAPNRVIPFDGQTLVPTGDELKRFDYVVLGDADTKDGLIAPYDEEGTTSTFVVEPCPTETHFDFWRRNANSDQLTGRFVDKVKFT